MYKIKANAEQKKKKKKILQLLQKGKKSKPQPNALHKGTRSLMVILSNGKAPGFQGLTSILKIIEYLIW